MDTSHLGPSSPEARAKAKLAFLNHVALYLLVIGGLAILNVLTSPRYLWFIWPMMGWGTGLLMHGLGVFFCGPERRLYDRLLEYEKRHGA